MIGSSKKLLMGAAGNAAGGAALDITEVFSTYLYDGNGSTQTITNGIDLAGEGGLVWIKNRASGDTNQGLFDTERGVLNPLQSNTTIASSTTFNTLTAFNSNGFALGNRSDADATNASGQDYASWTFRKAPKFFDVVTWTGDGTSDRVINHNLGVAPGVVIIKATSVVGDWWFTHRLVGTDGGNNLSMRLNTTDAATGYGIRASTDSPTTFTLRGTNNAFYANNNGVEYVAYLFAHNNGDGGFGPSGDQDIIKCGSVTTVSNLGTVDLGWEPQFVLIKKSSAGGDWLIFDSMRGMVVGSGDNALKPNSSEAEGANNVIDPTANGFKFYGSDGNYIYMAIRRGPLAAPTAGTEVFAIDEGDGVGAVSAYTSGFPVDFAMDRSAVLVQPNYVGTRLLQGTRLQTDGTNAELAEGAYYFDYMEGWRKFARAAGNYSWMWKRAPGFFDVVAYKGDAVAGRTVSHNLGVAPEMIWVKKRNAARSWIAYHSGIGSGKFLELDNTSAAGTVSTVWYDTDPTSTNFTVGTNSSVNQVPDTYIAYLFATLPGVSKVGSYYHEDGTPTNVDCGFTNGARFVLWKNTTTSGPWLVMDTTRGIVSGNDPYLILNNTDAENSSYDVIDPLSSGFTVAPVIASGTYIFYAIA